MLHHTANLTVRHAEQRSSIPSNLQVQISELKSVLDTFKSLKVPFFFFFFFPAVGTARDAISMQKICCQGNRGERERETLRYLLNTRTAAADVEHQRSTLSASLQRICKPCTPLFTHVKVVFDCFKCQDSWVFISASICSSVTPKERRRF